MTRTSISVVLGLALAACTTNADPDPGDPGSGGDSLPNGDGTGTVTFQIANGPGGNVLHDSYSGTGNIAFLTPPLIASMESGNCAWDLMIEPPIQTGSYTLMPFYDFTLALAGNTAAGKGTIFYREETACDSLNLPDHGWTSTGGTVDVTVEGSMATVTFDAVPIESSGNGDAVHGYLGTGPSLATGSAMLNAGSLTLTIDRPSN